MDKKTFLSASFWSFLQQFGFISINFVVSILLARMLMPSDFGVVGIALIFNNFANIISDGGLSSSLIRNKEVDESDYSIVFIINVVVSIILYFIIFFSAPLIADVFNNNKLVLIVRVVTLSIVISSLTIIQSVKLTKELKFKKKLILGLPALLLSGLISIYLAYNGFGVWSLICKDLIFSTSLGILLWLDSRWVPKLIFSFGKFKYHFNYGYKLLLTDLIAKIFNDSYTIVIGKYFSVTQLGLFSRAKSLADLPNGIIFSAINRVMFPLLAKVNDDDQRLKHIYSQIIKRVSFSLIPLLMLLLIFAKSIFIFLLTEKWLDAVPYFQVLILVALMSPLQSYNLNICKVKGRSDLVLKLSVFKYFLTALSLLTVISFGINGLLWSFLAVTIVEVIFTSYFAGKLINYTLLEQLNDIKEPFFYSIIAGSTTWTLYNYFFNNFINEVGILSSGCIIFTIIYLCLSYIFKNEVYAIFVSAVKSQLKFK